MHLVLQRWQCVRVHPRLASSPEGRRSWRREGAVLRHFLAAAAAVDHTKKQQPEGAQQQEVTSRSSSSSSKGSGGDQDSSPTTSTTTTTSSGNGGLCSRSTPGERDAVLSALRAYLCQHRHVGPADAADIARAAPLFSRKVVAAVKAKLARGRSGHHGRLDEATCREQARDAMVGEEVNVVEAYLESLGVEPRQWGELAPMVPPADLAAVIASVKVLVEDVGVQRRHMCKVLERDKRVLGVSAAEMRDAVRGLRELGLSRREIADLSVRVPTLLRVGLESVVAAVARRQEEEEEGGDDDGNNSGSSSSSSVAGGGGGDETDAGADAVAMLRKNVRYLKHELGFGDRQVIKLAQSYYSKAASRVWTSDLSITTRDNIGVLKEELGLTNANIRRVLSYTPAVITLSRASIQAKINYLQSLGVTRTGPVITRYPALLQYSIAGTVEPKVAYLQSLGIAPSSIGKVLTQCPSVLGHSLDAKLKPTVAFLESLGLRGAKLARLIVTKPPVLAYSVAGSLADTRAFLETTLGLEPGTPAMARAFAAAFSCSVTGMRARVDFFVDRGFAREWVRDMLRAQPSLLCLSESNLLAKLGFFQEDGVRMDLYEMPASKVAIYLSFGLESRMRPRWRVLAWLKERGHVGLEYPFARLLDLSEAKFFGKFVEPYGPAVAAVFHGRSSSSSSSKPGGGNGLEGQQPPATSSKKEVNEELSK